MGEGSTIEWLQRPGTKPASWNPIRARREVHRSSDKVGDDVVTVRGWYCEHVTAACLNCYAETQNKAGARGGTGLPYKPGHRKDVEIYLDEKTLLQPLQWRNPRTIFPMSMSDLYGDWVPDEWLDKIKAVQALTSRHTYIELTKRPLRMRDYALQAIGRDGSVMTSCRDSGFNIEREMHIREATAPYTSTLGNFFDKRDAIQFPLPNVWSGVSVGDQADADAFVPLLLQTPTAVRHLSVEPMLGPVALSIVSMAAADVIANTGKLPDIAYAQELAHSGHDVCLYDIGGIDWIIIGGESGPGAREFHYKWAADLIDDCSKFYSGFKVFMKQAGSNVVDDLGYQNIAHAVKLHDRKGGDLQEWPKQLQIRQWPR